MLFRKVWVARGGLFNEGLRHENHHCRTSQFQPKSSRSAVERRSLSSSVPSQRSSHESKATIAAPVTIRGTIPLYGSGVAIGQVAESDRWFSIQDVETFGRLVGDQNPLHKAWTMEDLPPPLDTTHPMLALDDAISSDDTATSSTRVLVHGMLVASIFSSIFGTLVPGAVYLNQSLKFHRPVYTNEEIVGRIEIVSVRPWRRQGVLVTCDTTVQSMEMDGEIWAEQQSSPSSETGDQKVSGRANVWLPSGSMKAASN